MAMMNDISKFAILFSILVGLCAAIFLDDQTQNYLSGSLLSVLGVIAGISFAVVMYIFTIQPAAEASTVERQNAMRQLHDMPILDNSEMNQIVESIENAVKSSYFNCISIFVSLLLYTFGMLVPSIILLKCIDGMMVDAMWISRFVCLFCFVLAVSSALDILIVSRKITLLSKPSPTTH